MTNYRKDNIVYCLAVYHWSCDVTVLDVFNLLERIVKIIGTNPDHAYLHVADTWNGKDYRYKNFIKRDLINREPWVGLTYDWRRQPDARLYLAASVGMHFELGPKLKIQIDEALVTDIGTVYEEVLALVAETLRPTYGIGFFVPYSWGPGSFMDGQGTAHPLPEEGLDYDSAGGFSLRGMYASRIMREDSPVLDRKLWDIFAINLLSERHLAAGIEGMPLKSWIEKRGYGSLRQLTPDTWRWDVPKAIQPRVRHAAIAAGLIADPFWVKLGWTDR
jgi:hypothetical protein